MTATRKPVSRTTRIARWMKSPAGQKLNHQAPALAVFAVAAYQSYWHTVEVAMRAGESTVTSHILPISVDGLMIVCARYITHSRTSAGKVMSFLFFVMGVVATLASNVLAANPTAFSRAVAVWPAVALVGTAAVLHWGEMKVTRKAPARKSAAASSPAKLKAVG